MHAASRVIDYQQAQPQHCHQQYPLPPHPSSRRPQQQQQQQTNRLPSFNEYLGYPCESYQHFPRRAQNSTNPHWDYGNSNAFYNSSWPDDQRAYYNTFSQDQQPVYPEHQSGQQRQDLFHDERSHVIQPSRPGSPLLNNHHDLSQLPPTPYSNTPSTPYSHGQTAASSYSMDTPSYGNAIPADHFPPTPYSTDLHSPNSEISEVPKMQTPPLGSSSDFSTTSTSSIVYQSNIVNPQSDQLFHHRVPYSSIEAIESPPMSDHMDEMSPQQHVVSGELPGHANVVPLHELISSALGGLESKMSRNDKEWSGANEGSAESQEETRLVHANGESRGGNEVVVPMEKIPGESTKKKACKKKRQDRDLELNYLERLGEVLGETAQVIDLALGPPKKRKRQGDNDVTNRRSAKGHEDDDLSRLNRIRLQNNNNNNGNTKSLSEHLASEIESLLGKKSELRFLAKQTDCSKEKKSQVRIRVAVDVLVNQDRLEHRVFELYQDQLEEPLELSQNTLAFHCGVCGFEEAVTVENVPQIARHVATGFHQPSAKVCNVFKVFSSKVRLDVEESKSTVSLKNSLRCHQCQFDVDLDDNRSGKKDVVNTLLNHIREKHSDDKGGKKNFCHLCDIRVTNLDAHMTEPKVLADHLKRLKSLLPIGCKAVEECSVKRKCQFCHNLHSTHPALPRWLNNSACWPCLMSKANKLRTTNNRKKSKSRSVILCSLCKQGKFGHSLAEESTSICSTCLDLIEGVGRGADDGGEEECLNYVRGMLNELVTKHSSSEKRSATLESPIKKQVAVVNPEPRIRTSKTSKSPEKDPIQRFLKEHYPHMLDFVRFTQHNDPCADPLAPFDLGAECLDCGQRWSRLTPNSLADISDHLLVAERMPGQNVLLAQDAFLLLLDYCHNDSHVINHHETKKVGLARVTRCLECQAIVASEKEFALHAAECSTGISQVDLNDEARYLRSTCCSSRQHRRTIHCSICLDLIDRQRGSYLETLVASICHQCWSHCATSSPQDDVTSGGAAAAAALRTCVTCAKEDSLTMRVVTFSRRDVTYDVSFCHDCWCHLTGGRNNKDNRKFIVVTDESSAIRSVAGLVRKLLNTNYKRAVK